MHTFPLIHFDAVCVSRSYCLFILSFFFFSLMLIFCPSALTRPVSDYSRIYPQGVIGTHFYKCRLNTASVILKRYDCEAVIAFRDLNSFIFCEMPSSDRCNEPHYKTITHQLCDTMAGGELNWYRKVNRSI